MNTSVVSSKVQQTGCWALRDMKLKNLGPFNSSGALLVCSEKMIFLLLDEYFYCFFFFKLTQTQTHAHTHIDTRICGRYLAITLI